MASGNVKTVITENLTEERKLTWLVGNFAHVISSKEAVDAQRISFEMGDSIGLPVKLRWKLQMIEEEKDDGKVVKRIAIYLGLDGPSPQGVTEVIASIGVKIKHPFAGSFIKLGSWADGNGGAHNLLSSDWGRWLVYTDIDIRQIRRVIALTADESLPIELLVRLLKINKTDSTDVLSSVPKFPNLSTIVKANEREPDVKILSKEGAPFHVSRAILCAGSPYFRELFQSKELMLRGKEKRLAVKIENLNHRSLDVLLTYLHTGTLKKGWSEKGVIEEVVYGADKLQIAELKKMLDIKLGKVCTVRNCGKLLGLAKQLGMKTAEVELLQFFEGKLYKVSTKQVTKFLKDSNSDNPLGLEEEKEGNGKGKEDEEDEVPSMTKIKKLLRVIFGK